MTFKSFFLLLSFLATVSYAQVGIGTNTPHATAVLEVNSSDKGILIPRLEANRISSMVGMANGLLVYAISTNTLITTTGFWFYDGMEWKKLGEGTSIYTADGSLSSNRLVNLSDKTLTFNGTTGRLIVDAPFESKKALYGRSIRLHPVANTITWQSDDVVIQLQNGHEGSILLPNAALNPNRMVGISNRSGSARDMAFVNNTAFGLYTAENLFQLPHNSVTWFQSDGISWNIISTNGQTTIQNATFASNVSIIGKVGQSSNFIVGTSLPSNGSFVDVQITTTDTSFPYLVSFRSNLVNGFYLNSDVVTITQSPATVRLFASGTVSSLGTGINNLMVTASSLNGGGQASIPVELTPLGLLNQLTSSASAAYSMRSLNNNYGGPLIRVFKSVSGVITELDIFAKPNGELDTQSLMSFAGSGSVAVKTWYDQSGNGNSITLPNSNFAIAPILVNNGNLISINTKPSANYVDFGFKSSGAFPSMIIGSFSSVIEITAAPNNINKRLLAPTVLLTGATGAPNYTINTTGTNYVNGGIASTIALGKATLFTNFSTISTYGGFLGNIAATAQTNAFPGRISEILLFPVNLNTTDSQLLETNQKNYYGL